MSRRLLRLAALPLLAGCLDLTVDPAEIVAVDLEVLPYPSLISGDTLRGADGTAVPLGVNVYAANGELRPEEPVAFFVSDTLTVVTGDRYLIARGALAFGSGVVLRSRIVASVASLQSVPRTIAVVPRPRAFARDGNLVRDTIAYSLPAAAGDTSAPLAVRVTGGDAGDTAVPARVVAFRLLSFGGQQVPATDTTNAFFLVSDEGRVSALDTTASNGVASRKLRFRIRQGQAAVDSVRVLAETRSASQVFSAVEWVVRVQPRQ